MTLVKTALFLLTALLLAGTVTLPATPAAAQSRGKVLTIFGNDKCPTNADGEEIVVCVRKPAGERYRVPQELRETEVAPGESFSDRGAAINSVNVSAAGGIGSCSNVGPGGQIGCNMSQSRAYRDAKRTQAEAAAASPLAE